ncbi:MAG: hypothetical protein PSV22_08795, partial [Pseudolabrys sp.]|nr:hypothetical protein [Pseudolabrys sp.]
ITVGAALTALLMLLSLPSPAQADDDWDQVRQSLLQLGVVEDRVEPLIHKIQDGLPLDSFGGVPAVAVEHFDSGGFSSTRSTYPDGSVSLLRSELPTEAGSTAEAVRSISGCSVTGPAYVRTYSNCTIDAWVGLYVFSFRADYRIQESSADSILDSYSPSVTCTWPATCGSATDAVNRGTENVGAGLPAEAEMTFTGNVGGVTSIGHLFLRVGSNGAWQAHVV